MSQIAQAQIVTKVVALLSAGLAASHPSVRIEETRDRPLSSSSTAAIAVRKLSSTPAGDPLLGAGTDWETHVRVECYARGSAAQQSADALLFAAHAVLQANPTLDGLVMAVGAPTLDWEDDELDTALSVAHARYPILHRTAPGTLAAAQ